MSVPNQDPESQHVGNGVTTVFAYGFLLLTTGDLSVYVDGVPKVLNVDYTVSGLLVPTGGSVTFSAPPANGAAILLQRDVELERTTTYQYAGDFQSKTVNNDYDRIWMVLQDFFRNFRTAVRFPLGEGFLNAVLPKASLRARKAIVFDNNGNVIVSTDDYADQAQNAAASAAAALAARNQTYVARDQVVTIAATFSDEANQRLDEIQAEGDAILDGFSADGSALLTQTAQAAVAQRAEIQSDANAMLAGLGYLPPVPYGPALSMSAPNQTVSYNGNTYAPIQSEIPFVTSGVFETSKFRLIQGVSSTDLQDTDGSGLAGVLDVLDNAKTMENYAEIEAYVGRAVGVRIKQRGLAPLWQVDPTDAVSANNGGTVLVDPQGRRWKPLLDVMPTVFQFGVVPGAAANAAANTAAFQNALDSAIAVRVPFVDDVINVTSGINFKNGRRLVFDSEYMNQPLLADPIRGVVGDGSGPVFTTNVYPGGTNDNREIRLDNARVWNSNFPCLELLRSDDAKLYDCAFNTTNANALKMRYSARVSIRGGSYRSRFEEFDESNWAITAYDNCNGLTITPDTIISGGANGGGADVSLSQKVDVDGIYEVCGTWGLRVAGYSGVGAGNCNGLSVAGYFEQCRRPLSLGAANLILGCKWGIVYTGNTALPANGVPDPDYCVQIGRVSGLSIVGGVSFHKKGTEPTIHFVQPSSGGGITDYLVNSVIENIHVQGGGPDILNALISADTLGFVFGRNRIKLSQNAPGSGEFREFVSPVITANVGKGTAAFIVDTGNGGVIDAVDVIEATGTLGCAIRVGHSGAVLENLNVDPSTLTLVSGGATVAPTLALIRPAKAQVFSVVAGTGTGSFRVRIRYRL